MLNFSLTKFECSRNEAVMIEIISLISVDSPYTSSRITGLYWSELISQMKLISH
jgi:hypothetical protein